jgi:phage/plasmid-associated DNA primase
LVVLSSNTIWSPKDTSTGLQRRIIYVPVTTIPEKVDRGLFSYDMVTNQGSGKLNKSLPGLVNWALGNNPENLKLLDNAVSTNNLINPRILEESNPLISWVKTYLTYEQGGAVSVGKKTSNPETHLYPHYLGFCKDFGFSPLSFNLFTTVLLQQLNVLINPAIQKKRITQGVVIQHLKLNNQPILEEDFKNPGEDSASSIMEEFHGFTEDS